MKRIIFLLLQLLSHLSIKFIWCKRSCFSCLVAYLGKKNQLKEQQGLTMLFLSKLPIALLNVWPKNLLNWMILDNWALLSFISLELLFVRAFIILIFLSCLVRNNSRVNYSYWKYFVVILTIVLVLFFAAYCNLFNCVFVSLTLDFPQ